MNEPSKRKIRLSGRLRELYYENLEHSETTPTEPQSDEESKLRRKQNYEDAPTPLPSDTKSLFARLKDFLPVLGLIGLVTPPIVYIVSIDFEVSALDNSISANKENIDKNLQKIELLNGEVNNLKNTQTGIGRDIEYLREDVRDNTQKNNQSELKVQDSNLE